jgi:hypothetical protein
MSDYLKAWQCIGCGKLEAPQNCIGICQDRRVDLVYAAEYEAVKAELELVRAERDRLVEALRRVESPARARSEEPMQTKPRLRRPATVEVR